MAPVMGRLGVRVSLIEPGPVRTNLAAAVDLPARLAAAGPYADIFGRFIVTASQPRAEQRTPFGHAQSADEIATLVASVLADPDPALRYQTSTNARDFVRTKLADLDGSEVAALVDSWVGPADRTAPVPGPAATGRQG